MEQSVAVLVLALFQHFIIIGLALTRFLIVPSEEEIASSIASVGLIICLLT